LLAASRALDPVVVQKSMAMLERACADNNLEELCRTMAALVPEYRGGAETGVTNDKRALHEHG
jgi:hypothetical protein